MTPFNWAGYLDLAKQLALRDEESAKRSAISRAYYSVFCSAREHLRSRGIPPTGEAHGLVWSRFQNARRDCRVLFLKGDRLLKRRAMADYANSIADVRKEAEHAIAEADDFFDQLRQLGNRCP